MADDEVKIKLVAEDKYSQSIERQIKMMEKMAKRAEEINKRTKQSSKQVEEFNKRAKEIELRIRTNKVNREIQEIDKKYQALKKKFQGKALMIRLGIEDSIAQRMNSIKELTSKIKIGATNGTSKVFNKVKNDISALVSKSKVLRNLKVAIQDRAGPVVTKLRGKLQSLKAPYKITTYLQDRASTKLIKLEARAKWTASKLRVLKNIPAGVKDKASPIIEKIRSKTKWMSKGVKLAITAKDKVSGAIGGIKSKLGGLISMAAKGISIAVTVVGAGALSALKDGMQLEQQTVAMEHFIGYSNKDMSKADVSGATDEYMKYLRENASATPFQTSEVVAAGTNAIGVANGDIGKAKKMLELAEDMSAMNVGTTVEQAMEALSDAGMGEFGRMAEFKFKAGAEEWAAAGGDIMNLMDVNGNALTEKFAGGAEKLSKTASGMWSTITGNLGEMKTDIGTQLLEKVKPGLEKTMNWLSEKKSEITENISGFLSDAFNGVGDFGDEVLPKLVPLVDTVMGAFEQLKPTFKSIGETAGKLFDSLLENGVPMLQDFMNFATPIFEKLWNVVLKPFMEWVISQMPVLKEAFRAVLDFLEPKLGTIIDVLGILGSVAKVAWEIIKFAIQLAWTIIEPILTGIYNRIQDAIDKVKEAQEKYGPALSAIGGFFTAFKDTALAAIGWIIDKLGLLIGKAQEAKDALSGLGGETSVTGGDGSAGSGGGSGRDGERYVPRATGIRNVPRDNYPALLHKGEAVVPARDNRGKGKGGSITVAKLADTIVVREEADIDKIASRLVKKIEEADMNMA